VLPSMTRLGGILGYWQAYKVSKLSNKYAVNGLRWPKNTKNKLIDRQ
jgi:hypothetical protein